MFIADTNFEPVTKWQNSRNYTLWMINIVLSLLYQYNNYGKNNE